MDVVTVRVDAKGLACPEPVIRTKRALDEIQDGTVLTLVDNEVARNNVVKLAKSKGYTASFEKADEGYAVLIEKGMAEPHEEMLIDTHDLVVLITSSQLGQGDDKLGALLMKNFLFALSETSPLPQKILFLNSAVKLTSQGSDSLRSIEKMVDQGVSIESCGICLEYFHLKDALAVGSITNMYDVVDSLNHAKRVLTI